MSSPVRSFASQLNFAISINRLPNTTFDVQEVNLPGVTLGVAAKPTPFVTIPWQGEHLDFGEMRISFKVDEKFNNWFEIFQWMSGAGFPRNFQQYASLKQGKDKNLRGEEIVPEYKKETTRKIGNIYSQISLSVLTSHKNPLIVFDFVDAYPTALSELELRSTDSDVEYLTATTTFKYVYYTARLP